MKINKWYVALALGAGATALAATYTSCVTIPKGAKAVQPFDKDKYLGQWYEIARLDFKYEKDLEDVTANYSLNNNGSIKVDNRGHNYVKHQWEQSVGKAKFVAEPDVARLKVSFFGPFYAGYNVIAIDKNYQYALVAGNDLSYLWILSRNTTIPESIKTSYLHKAKALGYDIDKLVWTKHSS
jgi:apolipoprotein D and lipocalin family protein